MLPRSPGKNLCNQSPTPRKLPPFGPLPPPLGIPVALRTGGGGGGMELHDTHKKQMVIFRGIIYNCLACQHRKSMTSRKTRNYYF